MQFPFISTRAPSAAGRCRRVSAAARRASRRPSTWLGLAIAFGAAASIGCPRTAPVQPPNASAPPVANARPTRIIAQGQLLPAGGLIRLNGTPGDVIEAVLVKVGDQVTAGQQLIEMRSASYRQSQLETLRQQLAEAELQQAAAVDRAEIELSAARMQLSQAEEQIRSVQRREQSLPLLKRQWDDAQAALERAQAMSQDPLTRALVSRLDVDKQRASA
ncbi:MAG: hypothetical protein ACTHOU_09165, partial [Aureliella sp.]